MVGFDSHTHCIHCRHKGKGTDPCVTNEDCQFCNVLAQEQKSHLATPSYQKKKEKHDNKAIHKELSNTHVDPALVSVLGVRKDRQDLNSEEVSSTPDLKAKKTQSSEESSIRNAKDRKTDSKDPGKAVKNMFTS